MKALIFDVETVGLKDLSIFDFGYTIVDLDRGEAESKGFLIDEVYNTNNVQRAFFYEKNKDYYNKALQNKELEIVKLSVIREELLTLLLSKDISIFGAFNMNFDIRALNYTFQKFNISKQGIKYSKLSKFVTLVDPAVAFAIVESKEPCYRCWCKKNGFITPVGNVKTTAEIIYKYVKNDKTVEEKHTAMEDSQIEADILNYSFIVSKDKEFLLNKANKDTLNSVKPYVIFNQNL